MKLKSHLFFIFCVYTAITAPTVFADNYISLDIGAQDRTTVSILFEKNIFSTSEKGKELIIGAKYGSKSYNSDEDEPIIRNQVTIVGGINSLIAGDSYMTYRMGVGIDYAENISYGYVLQRVGILNYDKSFRQNKEHLWSTQFGVELLINTKTPKFNGRDVQKFSLGPFLSFGF